MDSNQTANPPNQSQETESLVRRLAGPSVGKAGLAKDQTEINRIISDASKGSKFYENEKKKNQEVTLRIEKILKQRDEVIRGANIVKIESTVDQLISQLEKQRDLTQIIVHVDMDAFFANVEQLDNPELIGKPFAVVARGVVSTASYEARKFGVRSGMAGFIAKKLCPQLIFVDSHYSRYSEMSDKVMDIFHRYDPNMCPAGCDEGYLNITKYCEDHSLTALECVREMRETVFQETKLTVSAGIAPNKMLAKICSDKNKPNGQFQLEFDSETIKAFMCNLSIRKVPGIGRVNERLLEAIGIKTCGDVYTQRAILSLMDKHFGLIFLLRTHLGIASNVVQPYRREERKSIGAERTFSTLEDLDQILSKLEEVAVELEKDMEQTGWIGRTVTLKYKLNTYQVFTRAKSLDHWVSRKEELYSIGKELLLPEYPLKLRLIGLRVTKLKDLRDSGNSAHGIKRFFESARDNSPRKKAKVEDIPDDMDDSMPGFHEDDENYHKLEVDDLGNDDEVIELREISPAPIPHRPPHSTTNAHASTSKLETSTRPRSNSEGPPSQTKSDVGVPRQLNKTKAESHQCPICEKILETDNEGLNAHVDFCLSRGAILEAQVEANKRPPSKSIGWLKPTPSSNKGDTKSSLISKAKLKSKRGK